MSHNINEQRIAYFGERPWHGIGTELKGPATSEEAIQAARLDYGIQLQPIMTDFKVIENRYAVAREDNNDVLGIVSGMYKIFQNRECFSFFDSVVGEGHAMYHTAGALGKGEKIWLLAKIPNNIVVYRDDVVEKFLCLTNSHDGKSNLKMYYTPVRVVCQNTLTMSLSDAHDGISIRHTGNIKDKIEEAKRILGLSLNFYNEFEQVSKELVKHQMNSQQLEEYFNRLIWGNAQEDEEDQKGLDKKLLMFSLFEHGKGNNTEGIRGSAWAAYNAVTEYVDHHTTIRGIKQDPTNRLKNIWFGNGAINKRNAYDLIKEYANV